MLLNWLTEKRASVVDAPVAVSAAAAAAVALEPLEPAAGVDGGEARRGCVGAVQLQVGANDVHHCRADARWNSHPAPAESGAAAAYVLPYVHILCMTSPCPCLVNR